jgi:hypothetical protein
MLLARADGWAALERYAFRPIPPRHLGGPGPRRTVRLGAHLLGPAASVRGRAWNSPLPRIPTRCPPRSAGQIPRSRPRPLVTLSVRPSECCGPSRGCRPTGLGKRPRRWPGTAGTRRGGPPLRVQQTVPDQELVRRLDPRRPRPDRGAPEPVLIAAHATSSYRRGSRAGTDRPGPSVFGAYGAQSSGRAAGCTSWPSPGRRSRRTRRSGPPCPDRRGCGRDRQPTAGRRVARSRAGS